MDIIITSWCRDVAKFKKYVFYFIDIFIHDKLV